jgi:hypothetical protein
LSAQPPSVGPIVKAPVPVDARSPQISINAPSSVALLEVTNPATSPRASIVTVFLSIGFAILAINVRLHY